MKKNTISAIVIARNAEDKIGNAIKSVLWMDEVIVVDNGSSDKTIEISKKLGAKVVVTNKKTFSDWRNIGLDSASGNFVFYLDTDEVVSDELRKEIQKKIVVEKYSWYAIPRKNIILGQVMKHGGWYPDYVKRLFKRNSLKGWKGDLHEEPVIIGDMGYLRSDILHYKHTRISEMVEKTNNWSEIEAKLLFESGHPKMVPWRFVRIMISEAFYRLVIKRGVLDGSRGIIYALYQMWSKYVTYVKLWELQLNKK